MKTVKKSINQKLYERKKYVGTVSFVSWLATYYWEKKYENYKSVGAGAHKVGKTVTF